MSELNITISKDGFTIGREPPNMKVLKAMTKAVWTDETTKNLNTGVIGVGYTTNGVQVYVNELHPLKGITIKDDNEVFIEYILGMPTEYVDFLQDYKKR